MENKESCRGHKQQIEKCGSQQEVKAAEEMVVTWEGGRERCLHLFIHSYFC